MEVPNGLLLGAAVTPEAVTFRLKITEPALQDSVVVTHRVHAVPATAAPA
jgi:hypothetical protein